MSANETYATPTERSCLYECRVRHQRLSPKAHRFEYGIFMLAVDLAELDALNSRLRWFSRNRWNIYEFRDSDHLIADPSAADLRTNLSTWLQTQGVTLPPDAHVLLVTLPRVFGYIFAPVSFYFCHSADGIPLGSVAEVQNTFGELKPYFIPPCPTADGAERFQVKVPKHYYVSPFSELDLHFDFKLRMPGERLELVVNDVRDDALILTSSLVGQRRPLNDGQLLRLTVKYPLITLRVITLIHWHALKLWLRRLPWYPKAAQPEQQRGVFRPHSSISGRTTQQPPVTPSTAASTSPKPNVL